MGLSSQVGRLLLVIVLFAMFLQPIAFAGPVVVDSPDEPTSSVEFQDPSLVDIDAELETERGETEVMIRLHELSQPKPNVDELKAHAERTQQGIEAFADNHDGVSIEQQYWLTNAILLTVDTDEISLDELSRFAGVERLEANAQVEVQRAVAEGAPSTTFTAENVSGEGTFDTTYGVAQIHAPEAWSTSDTKGEGINVAILDTGVDPEHDDIDLHTADQDDPTYPGGWAEFDSTGDQIEGSEPYDSASHGTHVSGTATGGNTTGQFIGVAPDANLMHAKVMDGDRGSISQIIAGMEWAVENDADVISMSLGSTGYYAYFIDPIRNAESQDTVVIASIGNDGENLSSSPGNEYDTLSVGSSDSSENVSGFSMGELIETDDAWGSSAPDDWLDEYLVPSVVAPGSWIPSSVPDDEYRYKSGTSMAAPHVAGAVALIQSATDNHHSPDEITDALQKTAWKPDHWDEDTAEDSLDGQDTRYGHGIIDVASAIAYLEENQEAFVVSNATLTADTITAGGTARISATLENVGDESGDFEAIFELTNETGDVTILDVKTESLDPGESTTVELAGDVEEPGTYQTSVSDESAGVLTVDQPATFELSDGSLSEETVSKGEAVTILASVENVGDLDGSFTAGLEVDDRTVDTKEITIHANSSQTIAFDYEPPEEGEFDIAVIDINGDGEAKIGAGTLLVQAPANLVIVDASPLNDTITTEEAVTVTGTVENDGDVAGELQVAFEVDGDIVDSKQVTVAGGETETVTFTANFDESGTYDLSVNGIEAGTLVVEQPASFAVTNVALEEESIVAGESVQLTAVFENAGDRDGTVEAIVIEDGSMVEKTMLSISAGESETVTFERTYDNAGEYELAIGDTFAGTLTVEEPAVFELSAGSLGEEEISAGETTTVTAIVENTGDQENSFTAELEVDGTIIDRNQVVVAPRESEYISFTFEPSEPGEYMISVRGDDNTGDTTETVAGSLGVVKLAGIEVTDASVVDDAILEGEPAAVMATVKNHGKETGELALTLEVDDESVEMQQVSLEAGESKTITFKNLFERTGSHTVAVNGVEAGSLTVERPANFSVIEFDIEERELTVHNQTTVTALVENTGDVTGTFVGELEIDEDIEAIEQREIPPGETKTIEFVLRFDEIGSYEIELANVTVESVTSTVSPSSDSPDQSDEQPRSYPQSDTVDHTDERDSSTPMPISALVYPAALGGFLLVLFGTKLIRIRRTG